MKKIIYYCLVLLCFSSFGYGEEIVPIVFQDKVDNYEYTVYGTRNGTFADTNESDDVYERITEINYRYWWYWPTKLDHRWSIDVTGGDTVTLYMEAHCGPINGYSEDNYYIRYNTDLYSGKTNLFTIRAITDTLYSAELPSDISGTVYIYVEDTDRSPRHSTKNSVYIDQMYIESVINSPYASNPEPAHDAINVDEDIELSWDTAARIAEHDVYLGTDYNAVEAADYSAPEYKGNQTGTTFVPGSLTSNTTYYWRIDEVIDSNTYKGEVWSFTVYQKVQAKSPVDGSTSVYNESDLTWEPNPTAESFNVYFGQNSMDVESATTDSLTIFKGNIDKPDSGSGDLPTFDPGLLTFNQCYYWRIDEIDSAGVIHTGPVWKFFVPGLKDGVPTGMDPAIGGGEGYEDLINISDYEGNPEYQVLDYADLTEPYDDDFNGITLKKFMIVDDKETLLDALNNRAVAGDIVYIGGETEIDLYGEYNIPVRSGVKLCGERGKILNDTTVLKGALIFTDQSDLPGNDKFRNLFSILGSGARITGLRIRGPRPSESMNYRRGISIFNGGIAEIDNCELFNWGYAAVDVNQSAGVRSEIHHNYIHNTQREYYNYGVESIIGYPDIYANVFELCGHSMAGDGGSDCSYEARYNIVLTGLPSGQDSDNMAQFDMHIKVHADEYLDFINWAGEVINIHHNTFSWPPPQGIRGYGIFLRGRPRTSAEVHDNWFFHPTINKAVRQGNPTNGNMTVIDNVLGFEFSDGCAFEPVEQGGWTNNQLEPND